MVEVWSLLFSCIVFSPLIETVDIYQDTCTEYCLSSDEDMTRTWQIDGKVQLTSSSFYCVLFWMQNFRSIEKSAYFEKL